MTAEHKTTTEADRMNGPDSVIASCSCGWQSRWHVADGSAQQAAAEHVRAMAQEPTPTVAEKLTAALAELEEWTSGRETLWNVVHGSVTGDYEGQELNTIRADSARVVGLSAIVTGLAALLNSETAAK